MHYLDLLHFNRELGTCYSKHIGLYVSEAATHITNLLARYNCWSFHIREQRNNITVTSLSEEERTIPNPVKTFEQAFSHYRKLKDCMCLHDPVGYRKLNSMHIVTIIHILAHCIPHRPTCT